MSDVLKALDSYRDAVANRARWEDKGTRRDGNLEKAQEAEKSARRDLLNTIRDTYR